MPDSFVQWKAPYGSAQLNRKFDKVVPSGVYQGYVVSVAGSDTVDVSPPASGPSVALVERNGYQLTVRESATLTLTVPGADGLYHVVVEIDYTVGQTTTSQLKVVEEENEADHQVIVGSVERSGGSLTALPEAYREFPAYPTSTRAARKTANESVSSSTTLQTDNHLSNIRLRGDTDFLFRAVLRQKSGQGGIDVRFNIPSDATLQWYLTAVGRPSQESDVVPYPSGAPLTGNSRESVTPRDGHYHIHGYLTVESSGSLDLEWAQGTSHPEDTAIMKGSIMHIEQI